MSRRIAGWTTVMLAALCPALCLAQQFAPQMQPPVNFAGYGAPFGNPDAAAYGSPSEAGGYCPPQSNWTRYTQLPDDCGFAYGDTELDKMIENIFRHAFFRVEYLNWAMSDPGSVLLGAPILNPSSVNVPVRDPRIPFDIFNPITGTLLGQGISPTLDQVHLQNNNGIRGTWGFNFEPFKLEASVFALQASRANALTTTLPFQPQPDYFDTVVPDPIYIAQGVLVNGVPQSNAYLIYDTYYQAILRTNVWGADAKVVLASYDLNSSLQLQPLFGVKFVNFNESLNQSGISHTTPGDSTTDVFSSQINSSTRNYLYGPQIGFRAELVSSHLTVGVEPKVMLGANSYQAKLNTQGLAGTTDFGQSITENKTTFGPVADFQTYAQGRISEHLSVFVAFNLMWAGMITRPYENIVYNVNAAGDASLFQQDVHFTDLLLYGVSVGGQVDW